jgi:hypothetical protein
MPTTDPEPTRTCPPSADQGKFPEHDKLTAVADQTQTVGEFIEWLHSQGIHFMTWREDLTDSRNTNPECNGKFDSESPLPCYQTDRTPRPDDPPLGEPLAWWRRHCLHWLNPGREAAEFMSEQGHCCRCGKGRHYEVTGIHSWVEDGRSIQALLAGFFGIDQNKIEAEKRQMLASLPREANAR